MKKLPTVVGTLLVAMCAGFAIWCAQSSADGASLFVSDAGDGPLIGILQPLSHPSLDQIREGMIDQLRTRGYREGDNLRVLNQNANDDKTLLPLLATQLAVKDPEIVVGIGTTSAQALDYKFGKDFPVVLGATSNPVEAGLAASEERPGPNRQGVMDRPPIDAQFQLIQTFVPDAQTIGIIYNSSEQNVLDTVKRGKQTAEAHGYTVKEATITSTTELKQVAEQLAQQVDAVWVPNDNTLASAMPTLLAATDRYRVPVFPVVDNMVAAGGVATVGINQYAMGQDIGNVVADMLDHPGQVDQPLRYTPTTDIVINQQAVDRIGLTVPPSLSHQVKRIDAEG